MTETFKYISAFDLDRTLLKVNCSFHFGKFLYAKGILPLPKTISLAACYAGHVAGLIGLPKLHVFNFASLFLGKEKEFYDDLVDDFLDRYLEQLIYPPAFKAYMHAKQEGHFTAIFSSSPNFLVQPVAERLAFDRSYSTVYNTNASGVFASLGTIVQGEEKARLLGSLAIQLQVSRESLYAYSDSHLDLPFMEAAGHPIAVKPNRKLERISINRGWKILS